MQFAFRIAEYIFLGSYELLELFIQQPKKGERVCQH